MNIFRNFPAKGFIEQIVFWSGRQIFTAPDHRIDLHQMIVHYIGKIIGGHSIRFQKDPVIQGAVFHRNGSKQLILKSSGAGFGNFLADDIGLPCLQSALHLFPGQIPAMAVIPKCTVMPCGLPKAVQTFLRTKTIIRSAKLHQLSGIFLINGLPFRLNIWTIWAADIRPLIMLYTYQLQGMVNQLHSTLDKTILIRIFDAENEFAMILSGNQISIQSRSQASDMKIASGARGKPRPYLIHKKTSLAYYKNSIVCRPPPVKAAPPLPQS